MATRYECDCIESAIKAARLASGLEETSFIYANLEKDLEFKRREINPSIKLRNVKSLRELVYNTADSLNQELQNLERVCDFSSLEKPEYDSYNKGKGALKDTILDRRVLNLSNAYLAGNNIGKAIQDVATQKYLVSCK